jgi:putative DNA primase/helicase
MSADRLDAALSYAARLAVAHLPRLVGSPGAVCVPRRQRSDPGKHPIGSVVPRGLHDATTDPARITRWWAKAPHANVAIATGRESGVIVLDVDPRAGGDESLRTLEATHGALPVTVEALTGGGGRHLFFAHPEGEVRIPNSASKLGGGLDVRADGGYVVAPPSVHASGRSYEWNAEFHPDEVPLAPVPPWLLGLMVNGAGPRGAAPPVPEVIPEGQRNHTLASMAGTMRRRGMTEPEILAALLVANAERCQPPLPEAEVRAIAASVARYAPADSAAGNGEPEVGGAAAATGDHDDAGASAVIEVSEDIPASPRPHGRR